MSAYLAPQRPRTVTIVLWGVFLLGAWNAGRAVVLLGQRAVLLELGVAPAPGLRLIVALLWASIFWSVALGLRWKRPITRRLIPLLLFLYALFEFGFLFFLVKSTTAQRAWLMYLVFHLGMLSFSAWALNRSAASVYFRQDRAESGENRSGKSL